MSASNDGTESVDQFLARIASLSRRNDEEEAERNRRMEEEMMQARKERRARREERARSLSPVKTGPAAPMSSPRAIASPPERSIDPPVTFTPRSQTQTPTRRERSPSPLGTTSFKSSPSEAFRPLPPPPQEKPTPPTFAPSNASTLSRSGTLSWQQRPTSRDGPSIRSRPQSAARSAFREPVEMPTDSLRHHDEPEPSRADIAASLGARDPSWFRQTADRGVGSAAYRRSTGEATTTDGNFSRGMRLPGLAGESAGSEKLQNAPERESAWSPPPSAKPSHQPAIELDERAQFTEASRDRPLPATSPSSFDPKPLQDITGSLGRTSSVMSSARRPPSPTKGLGGFVESAMMRRSDSVSKRWSVQANTGLKRGDSVASNRPTFNPPSTTPSLGQARALSREPRALRDGTSSPLSSSRPTSSHGSARPIPVEESKPEAGELSPKAPSTSRSTVVIEPERANSPPSEALLSRSPSKTLDPRRWSPTKASWLESALSKPESPRPAPTKPELPAWKVGLERSKSQKNLEGSPTRPSSFEPVSTGGLLRSPPPTSPTKTPTSMTSATSLAHTQLASTATEPSREVPHEQIIVPKAQNGPSVAHPPVKDSSKPNPPSRMPAPELTLDAPSKSVSMFTKPPSTSRETTPETRPDFRTSTNHAPPTLRPKPQTPPKADLRSTLRTRQAGTDESHEKEPEFKAAFGKLKRTQTRNYVAPDVLKDNIARGKAALSLTSGPQKTKRVDEFKENILQRKEDMKAGGGSIHRRSESPVAQEAMSQTKTTNVPEALARQKTLHRTKVSSDAVAETPVDAPPKPARSKPVLIATGKADAAAIKPTSSKATAMQQASGVLKDEQPESKHVSKVEPAHPAPPPVDTTVSAKPVQKASGTGSFLPPAEPVSRTATTSPDEELSKSTSNKLAARMNPALANLIGRGNSPRPQTENTHDRVLMKPGIQPVMSSSMEDHDGSAGLTHITKGRAKGPKRRAPKVDTAPAEREAELASLVPEQAVRTAKPVMVQHEENSSSQAGRSSEIEQKTPQTKPVTSPKAFMAQKPPVISPKPTSYPAVTPSTHVNGATDVMKGKPRVASKSPELRRVSDKQKANEEQAQVSLPKATQGKAFSIAADQTSQESKPSTPTYTDSPVRASTRNMPLTSSKTKVNSPKMPNPAVDSPFLKAIPKTGLGLYFIPDAKQKVAAPELTPPPETEIRTSDKNGDPKDVKPLLLDFFGAIPRSTERLDFDTEAFLQSQYNGSERVKTLSSRIVEVTGDGKQSPMPASQEHILYENLMYLCIHSFEKKGSQTAEVYLWAGDAVSEAAIQDAQIFCKKVARENSAKLEVIKQGKESTRFFSAIGGILIIRKSKSSALYMLCGRRHGGHVVFDEVDFRPASLGSGFSFLISAKFGKLYLWIGVGSCADEYGAARLIGTDLGLTGEIEEVSEGKEPASFWECFATPSAKQEAKSSEMWSMRAGNDHNDFPCKLYRVEQERPKSSGGFWGLRASSPPKSSNKATLQEINPFAQQDLDGSYVHLLDAYASIYVIPGKASPSKAVDFVSALHIAQELAILTPSMQDRAVLPSCQIVFGEPPHDFRSAFRKWTPGLSIKHGKQAVCLDLADVMGVLG